MPRAGDLNQGKIYNSKEEARADYTYQDYRANVGNKDFKSQLDAEYAYRLKLEKIFQTKQLAENKKAQDALDKYRANQAKKERQKELQELYSNGLADKAQVKELNKLNASEQMKNEGIKAIQNMAKSIGDTLKKLSSQVDSYISVFTEYTSSINTRLQGTDKTFQGISNTISGKLFGSPYVKQTQVLEKLNQLVSEGIAYNVEQRAFLASMSDKIATTFDAANGALLRLIRLQQADTTAARMGIESSLNKFLNNVFEDTSYLTNTYDTIESTLVDAISQLGYQQGVELEYVIQKWLGALSSVGFSEGTLTSIAQGLNYLATGDVTSLSSNTSLQNLLIMAASRSGSNYSSILSGGLNAETANALLQGIVEYGKEIASSGNQVVRAQYANLFGMTLSDMTALLQLSTEDLKTISENMLSYAQTVRETNDQLKSVGSRMSTAELVKNVYDNVMLSTAEGIANSAGMYATWLVTNLVEQAVGGINIPTISAYVMGTGVSVDLNATVTDLMKVGIMGASLLSQIGNIVSGLQTGGALSLEGWGASEFTSRGTGFQGIDTGVSTTTSGSMYIGNSSGSDIYESSVTSATNEATSSVQGQEEADNRQEEMMNNIDLIAQILSDVFSTNALRVVVDNYGLVNTDTANFGMR